MVKLKDNIGLQNLLVGATHLVKAVTQVDMNVNFNDVFQVRKLKHIRQI